MLDSKWRELCLAFEGNEDKLFLIVSIAVLSVVFWSATLSFTLVDVTGRPAAVLRYKIQAHTNLQIGFDDVRHVLGTVAFNQLAIGIPGLYLVHPTQAWMGMDVTADVPPVTTIFAQLAIFAIAEEIGFYYSHRLLHHPRLYRRIHKQHHEWTSPIALVTVYSHPVEFVVSSFLPLVAGPVLCGAHPVTTWLWYSLAILTTIVHHSGYHLPFLPSPEFHDYHHLKFNQNYGVLGILDWFHNTDSAFRQSKQFEMHKVIFYGQYSRMNEASKKKEDGVVCS